MAITHYYVDPSIAGDSGTGTLGDPYGDLQFALNTVTRNATDGDVINIKSGTSEILAAALDRTSYGNPTSDAPLVFWGYDSAQGDGGVGTIDGNASFSVFDTYTIDGFIGIDMRFTNCGANDILRFDNENTLYRCEVDTTTGAGVSTHMRNKVVLCNIHDCAIGVEVVEGGCNAAYCYFKDCSTHAIHQTTQTILEAFGGVSSNAHHCVFSISDAGANGVFVEAADSPACISNCSFFHSSTTGTNILIADTKSAAKILNNLCEGGGVGIQVPNDYDAVMLIANSVYNATTNDFVKNATVVDFDNESLGSSPFSKSGADSFANRDTWYKPNDVGSVLTSHGDLGGWRGAVQTASASTGGMLKLAGLAGLAG